MVVSSGQNGQPKGLGKLQLKDSNLFIKVNLIQAASIVVVIRCLNAQLQPHKKLKQFILSYALIDSVWLLDL